MKVLILEHQWPEAVVGVMLDDGSDRWRRRVFEPVLFEEPPHPPYVADIDDGVVQWIETAVVEPLGEVQLGAKGANTIGAGTFWPSLDLVRGGLTRSKARGFEGKQGFSVDGQLVINCVEQSIDEVIDQQAQQTATEERARQLRLARAAQEAADAFINPYTFVPFPAECPPSFRTAPAGHAKQGADRLSGWFDVTFTAATPLMTSGPGAAGSGTKAKRFPRDVDGRPIITGSSLKGAVRALHEVLAGGCLRVFDEQFVPVYRELAHVLPSSWKLVRVEQVVDGVPLRFQVSKQVVWTEAGELHRAIPPSELVDGAKVTIGRISSSRGRELGHEVTAGGDWLVHITDAGARGRNPYYAACGLMSGDVAALAGEEVWNRYRRVVDGASDLQSGGADVVVRHASQPGTDRKVIGKRTAANRNLKVGDVLWADVSNGLVKELKLSYLWRSEGEGAMGDRVPDWLHPCTSHDLCPSCRLFGSADDRGGGAAKGGRAEQLSYRGHVRFTDAVLTKGELEDVELAPMGAPRPGAGAFYLSTDGKRRARADTETPTARWGSSEDRPLRQMLGRKFYWNADPASQQPRRDRRGVAQRNEKMGGSAEVAPASSEFATRVAFTNLSPAEVGALVACFRPAMALAGDLPDGYSTESPVLQLRLGGGKPLGYGAVDVEITSVCVQSAAVRYLGEQAAQFDLQSAVDAFRAWVPPSVRAIWPDIAAVLRRDHVNPARVAYPPGANWPEADQPEPAQFRSPFEFFKKVTGSYSKVDDGFQVLSEPPRSLKPQLDIPGNEGKG